MSIPIRVDVKVHRAQPVGQQSIPRTTIVVDETMPDVSSADRLRAMVDIMDEDAQAIADALFNSLPGGTLDRLTVLFLQRKISHFVVNR